MFFIFRNIGTFTKISQIYCFWRSSRHSNPENPSHRKTVIEISSPKSESASCLVGEFVQIKNSVLYISASNSRTATFLPSQSPTKWTPWIWTSLVCISTRIITKPFIKWTIRNPALHFNFLYSDIFKLNYFYLISS